MAEHGVVCAKVKGKSSNTNEDVIHAFLCVYLSTFNSHQLAFGG